MAYRIHYSQTRAKYPSSVHPVRTILPQAMITVGLIVAFIDMLALGTSASKPLDTGVVRTVAAFRFGPMVLLSKIFTFLGSTTMTVLWVALAALAFWLTKHKVQAAFIVCSIVGSGIITWILKHIVNRPRPDITYQGGNVEDPYSFPSGHTLNSTVFYGTLALIALYATITTAQKILITVLCTVMPLMVGFSRIYLAQHWVTDVLGGLAVGLAWLGCVALAYAWIAKRQEEKPEADAHISGRQAPGGRNINGQKEARPHTARHIHSNLEHSGDSHHPQYISSGNTNN